MARIDFPHPLASPFVDEDGLVYEWNGIGWVRYKDPEDRIEEAPFSDPTKQYVRESKAWVDAPLNAYYLGAFDQHPTVDPESLVGFVLGASYYNTTLKAPYLWNGRYWKPYGEVREVHGLSQYFWINHTALNIGDALNATDDYGNTYSGPWTKGTEIIGVFSNGIRLVEQLPAVPATGDFLVDYATGIIMAVNAAIPAGPTVLELFNTGVQHNKLYPYVKEVIAFGSSNPTDYHYEVHGGNFSNSTNVTLSDNSYTVLTVNAVTDNILNFIVSSETGLPNPAAIVYVTNGINRAAFGPEIVLGSQPTNPPGTI